jgi:YfiH family protein
MQMKSTRNNSVVLLQSPLLERERNILHFTTTRHGGVSEGHYASLNLGEYCGDKPAAVRRNRASLCATLGISPTSLYVPRQVHSYLSMYCGQGSPLPINNVDALITCDAGICVAVSTADCVPILLYATDQKVVAAVHAGWRGTLRQIAAKTVRRMVHERLCNPRKMLAIIAPAIGQEAFEVGEEVYEAFVDADMDREICIRNEVTGKMHIDLKKANYLQLLGEGIPATSIDVSALCTYSRQADFFSARRLGTDSGRMLTGILMKNI